MPFGWKITMSVPSVAAQTGLFVFADMAGGMLVIGTSPTITFPAGATGFGPKEGLALKQQRKVQRTENFRAAYQLAIPRFNLSNTFAFTVQRAFQTPEACAAFVLGHADSVPIQGELIVQQFSNTGNKTGYLPNAIIDSVEIMQHQEIGCQVRYSVLGNGPWQNSP